MKFEVTANLKYTVHSPGTIVLNIHALRSQKQIVLEETLTIDPYVKAEELIADRQENRVIRLELTNETSISLAYRAVVDNACKEVDLTNVEEVPIARLDPSVLPYLYPSRYCQSDKLYRFAFSKFGHVANPFEKVLTLTNWIHSHVAYLSGSTNSQTSAYDTVTELQGVCRDFAHLGIALCRALNIPARYFTGYAYKLDPQDFHACFEAYLGGQWILLDATKLVPLNGIVKIAHGRDAADTSVASLFGNIQSEFITASCRAVTDGFTPIYYDTARLSGISYM